MQIQYEQPDHEEQLHKHSEEIVFPDIDRLRIVFNSRKKIQDEVELELKNCFDTAGQLQRIKDPTDQGVFL